MPSISPTILLLLLSFFGLLIFQYILYPAFFSPLAKIPVAHWSARFTSAWVKYHRLNNNATFAVHEAHQRHGVVIRLAPDEISVNCIDGGLRTVYAGGYEKRGWYDIFQNYGVRPMFAMDDRSSHSVRKRMVSNLYGKSFLQSSQSLAAISKAILNDRLLPVLNELEAKAEPVEINDILSSITMDFVCAYTMGLKNATNFLGDLKHAHGFSYVFHELQKDFSWAQEAPMLTSLIAALKLEKLFFLTVPEQDKYKAEDLVLNMCDRAEVTVQQLENSSMDTSLAPEDYPTVYLQLRTCLLREFKSMYPDIKDDAAVQQLRFEIASELLDHTMAGYDTSAITLTYLAWQLSKPENLHWQDKLYAELANFDNDPRTLDTFQVLNGVLMETLRLNTAIPGNQPRSTPPNASLGPPGQIYSNLPAGIRVQAQAYSLHRNPDVFPDPEAWRPDRWINADEEHKKEMARWFWAFGSGGRMCVGSNLAMLEMKAVIKTIWTHFTTIVEFDQGMTHLGGYMAPPLGKDGKILLVRLKQRAV